MATKKGFFNMKTDKKHKKKAEPKGTPMPTMWGAVGGMAKSNPPIDFEKDKEPSHLRHGRKEHTKHKAVLLYQNANGEPRIVEGGQPAKSARSIRIVKQVAPRITPKTPPLR